MKTLRILLIVLAALAVGLVASANAQTLLYILDTPNPQEDAYFGWSLAMGDVNGDGKADIAVGTPSEHADGHYNQGRAYVFSGADGSLLLTLDTPNPQPDGAFGWSVAVGEVNGDGKADIAVAAWYEDVGENPNQGRAYVFSGADGSPLLTLDTPNPQPIAHFGAAVAVGEVNGDGKADIAVGECGGLAFVEGRAYVFSGLDGSLLFTLDSPNPPAGTRFGFSLAVGDVNGDGKADIAVGAYWEDVGGNNSQGRAYVFSGADGSLLFTLDTPNPQAGAGFGWGLAVGDVDGDTQGDTAVGASGQNRAYVFSGSDGSLLLTLESPDPQTGANFGRGLAVGDVNGDGKADIAVGAHLEDVGGNGDQGRAYVFSGADGSLLFTLDTPNPETDALFGWVVTLGELDGHGWREVAVGAPDEDVGGNEDQGRAYVFLLGPCEPGVDTDLDDFHDDVECYLGTDSLHNCPIVMGTPDLCPGPTCDGHDAWPLDLNVDTFVTTVGDVLLYANNMGKDVATYPELQRLDLNMDGFITTVGDVLGYSGMIGEGCTNP